MRHVREGAAELGVRVATERGKVDLLHTVSARWFVWQRRMAPYAFISPFYLLFLLFGLFPLAFSLWLSFHSWNPVGGLGTMEWAGLDNYVYLAADPWFWKALVNTLVLLVISGLPQHLVALPLAFALNAGLVRLRNLFTAAYFMPYITSAVAVAMIFSTIYGTQYGILNSVIAYLSRTWLFGWAFEALQVRLPINWLGSSAHIKPAIAMLVMWRWFGWNTVLYLTGLQTIPRELYEAAMVDGAGTAQQFRWITLPLLRPIALFAVTLTIVGNMQLFDEPFILVGTGGGTSQAGLTSALYLYRTGFEWLYMGSAAAMSWALALFIALLTWINFRIFGRESLQRREG